MKTVPHVSVSGCDSSAKATAPFAPASRAMPATHKSPTILRDESRRPTEEPMAEAVQTVGKRSLQGLLYRVIANDVNVHY